MTETKELKTTASVAAEGVFAQMKPFNHENVFYCNDNETGLRAIIAIHNTVLGPGLGGCRIWKYHNEQEALVDVLRLSRGMTYKASVAGLNLGGAKAVILGDSRTIKTQALMRRFGRFINDLGGKYITAEDVGSNSKDMEYIHLETNHVTGIPESMGGSGDPSPFTAYGVLLGMKAAAKECWGTDSLAGKKVAVQGIGNVGEQLVAHLVKEGAVVTITDINQERLSQVAAKYGATIVMPDEIYAVNMDIFAPCALGATVNSETIERLNCTIIAGSANNQLGDERIHGQLLLRKGILYAPDYVVNSGGLINVYSELGGHYNRETSLKATEKIYDVTRDIFTMAKTENIPTCLAANKIAEKRIEDAVKKK